MAPSMDRGLQFMVVGSETSGKSSACNVLVGKIEFNNTVATEHIQHSQAIIRGRKGLVSDTPGWDSNCSPDEPLKTLKRAFKSEHQSSVVLLTISIIQNPKIRQEEAQRLLNALQGFDSEIWSHTMILFTKADLLEAMGIEGYLQHNEEPMQKLLELCGHRYQTFSIYQGQQQVSELIKKVDRMLEGKRGSSLQAAVHNKVNRSDPVSEKERWRRKERDPEAEEQEDMDKDKVYELSQNQETEQHGQCPETNSSYHTARQKMEIEDIHKSEAGPRCGSEYTDETYSSKPDSGDNEDDVDQENPTNIKPTRDPEQEYNNTDCRWRITHPVYQETHQQVEQSDLLQVPQNKHLQILKNQSVHATANFSSINTRCHDAVRIQVFVCGGLWNPLAQPECIWFLFCFDKADLVLFLVLNLSVFFYFTGKNPEEPPAAKQEDDQITNPSHPVGSETRGESDRINTDGRELGKVTSSDAPEGLQSGLVECGVTADGEENSKSTETGTGTVPEETLAGGHGEIPKNNKNKYDEPDGGDSRVETNDVTVNADIKKTSKRRRRRRVGDVRGDLKKKTRGRKHADGSAVEEPIPRAKQESRSTDADVKPIRAAENHVRSSDHRQTRRGRRPERSAVTNGAPDRTELEAEPLREGERDFSCTGERKRAPDHRKRRRGSSEHLILLKCDRKSDDDSDVREVKLGGSWKLRRSKSLDRAIKFTPTRDRIQLQIDRDRQKTEPIPDFSCFMAGLWISFYNHFLLPYLLFVMATALGTNLKECSAPPPLAHSEADYRSLQMVL